MASRVSTVLPTTDTYTGVSLPIPALTAGKQGVDHKAEELAEDDGIEQGGAPGVGLVQQETHGSDAQHSGEGACSVADA